MSKELGEIFPKFYKVYYESATNTGFEPIDVKYFRELEMAKRYAKKLIKNLRLNARECDDFESVVIENEKGLVERWRAEYGEVVHYKN